MAPNTFKANGVRVAVEGCGHGTLDAIYDAVGKACKDRGWNDVDILIIGGDFQAVRNAADLTIMSCPVKYRRLGDFKDYYSGKRKAPYLTIFVGGNHEASSHLWELYYGGWVAPNIYYMGAANVLRFGPLRIAGMSGIWKGFDYNRPHLERLPFNKDDVKSFYHVREVDVRKLLLMRTQVDVGISHDWPRHIEKHGDSAELFRKKPFFREDSEKGQLGSVAAEYVMDRLRPPYWFSAHLHTKFAAIKKYQDSPSTAEPALLETADSQDGLGKEANPDEIDLDMDDEEQEGTATAEPTSRETEKKEDTAAEFQDGLEEQGGKAEPTSKAADEKEEEIAESRLGDLQGANGANGATIENDANDTNETNQVPDDLRAQLPASFAPPQQQHHHARKQAPGQPVPPGITNKQVRFVSLDKCLRGRQFLQTCLIKPFQSSGSPQTHRDKASRRYSLHYDPEWLAITRVFHDTLSFGDRSAQISPDLGEEHYAPLIDAERAWVDENIVAKRKLAVPENFEITAPPYVPGTPEIVQQQPDEYTNPQTAAFSEAGVMKMKVFKKVANMEIEAEDGAGVEEAEAEVEAEEEEEAGAEEEAGGDLGRPHAALLIQASFRPLRVVALCQHFLIDRDAEDIVAMAQFMTTVNQRTKNQFRPRAGKGGATSYQLRQYAEVTLGGGSLRKVVKLPEGEDENEWLAVNMVDFYNQINLLYGAITEFCSPQSCPEMKATDEFEYLWQDNENYKRPTKMPAPAYIEQLMAWVQSNIDNESVLPSKIGVPFPKSFPALVRQIFKRMYRVYAHIYCHHYPVIRELGLEPHLNTSFKQYVLFIDEHSLASGRDYWGPLGDLVDSMLKSD
ncbi:related to lariat-debranching enzyme [Claviceps purpurea 20.1]|uniref:Related to lariat-debranching enzyme n=4 Tax=Claviceps TaxID=5110 RepID=M1W7R0_CLAP2|nr:related to lariat-debranching enzyme [Claviceps purpurea 20.1]